MSYFHEWRTPIDVRTPLGDGESLGFIDYGYNVNSVWLVRMHGTGAVKHFDSADVVIYGNPMSRGGWDVEGAKPEDAELPNGHTVPAWAAAARDSLWQGGWEQGDAP
jgi:hypothetical protein